MPRNEGGRANPVDSVRTREKARSAVRKHQENRGSVTAARECAARLMAPGAALRDSQTFARMPGPILSGRRSEKVPVGSHFASDGNWRHGRLA